MMPSEQLTQAAGDQAAELAAGIEERLEEAERYIRSHAARVHLPSHEVADVRQELRVIAIAEAAAFDPACGVPWTAFLCRRLALRGIDLMRAKGVFGRDGKVERQPHISLQDSDEDQRRDMWEPADEGDDASDVDWRDLVDVASRECLQVRAIILRAGGLSQQQIANIAGVTESRVCQLLATRHRNYSDAIDRIRYLIGRADEPVRSDRWRRAKASPKAAAPQATEPQQRASMSRAA